MVAQDLDPPSPGGILNQQAGLQHVLPRIVHPGDQRDADDERPARKCTAMPGCAGWGHYPPSSGRCCTRVGVLHVEQHQIGVPLPGGNIRRGIAARLDGRMHPLRPATRQKHLSAANAAACRSGSPPVSVTPPRFMAYTALLRSSLPASSPEQIAYPHIVRPSRRSIYCGSGEMPSGLWHQAQRSGHPFRKTVVRIPGPSCMANSSMLKTIPFSIALYDLSGKYKQNFVILVRTGMFFYFSYQFVPILPDFMYICTTLRVQSHEKQRIEIQTGRQLRHRRHRRREAPKGGLDTLDQRIPRELPSLARHRVAGLSELKSRGIIASTPGVGYYIASARIPSEQNIFLLFNEFNEFKEDLYNSFMEHVGKGVSVDLYFHNYNRRVFDALVTDANGKYTTYIIMPGKFTGIGPLLESLSGRVFLLDHFHPELLGRYSSVAQNFEKDTYEARSATGCGISPQIRTAADGAARKKRSRRSATTDWCASVRNTGSGTNTSPRSATAKSAKATCSSSSATATW